MLLQLILIIKSVKIGNFVIWSKMIESYGYSVTGNGYSSLYGLYLFVLFFPHRLYCFSTRLTVILIFKNQYICLILFRVLWISKCPYNKYSYISRINCFCSFIGICNLLLFSFCCLLYLYICQCKSSLLFTYIIMLARFLYRK